jgi:hypothetical protein
LKRPPISESLVFIHAGGLHGVAMIFRFGFSARAWRSSGRISARSWAIEKWRRPKSVCPAGTSS